MKILYYKPDVIRHNIVLFFTKYEGAISIDLFDYFYLFCSAGWRAVHLIHNPLLTGRLHISNTQTKFRMILVYRYLNGTCSKELIHCGCMSEKPDGHARNPAHNNLSLQMKMLRITLTSVSKKNGTWECCQEYVRKSA